VYRHTRSTLDLGCILCFRSAEGIVRGCTANTTRMLKGLTDILMHTVETNRHYPHRPIQRTSSPWYEQVLRSYSSCRSKDFTSSVWLARISSRISYAPTVHTAKNDRAPNPTTPLAISSAFHLALSSSASVHGGRGW
jgi:hypothetical protein